MKKKNVTEKSCAFCEHSRKLIDEESALCTYKGAVSLEYVCRKFTFDPLKVERAAKKIKFSKIETL